MAQGKENLVCKLERSIYGLKQSPRCWNYVLNKKPEEVGFVQTSGDPCIYTTEKDEQLIIAVYVYDILIASKSEEQVAGVKEVLARHFDMKDMGELHHFLGVKIVKDPASGNMWIGHRPDIAYAVNNVAKFCSEPTKHHWIAVKRIMRYLKETQNLCLYYRSNMTEGCVGYSDANWVRDVADRRSASG